MYPKFIHFHIIMLHFLTTGFDWGVYAIYTKQTTVREGCSVLDFADSVSIAFFFFLNWDRVNPLNTFKWISLSNANVCMKIYSRGYFLFLDSISFIPQMSPKFDIFHVPFFPRWRFLIRIFYLEYLDSVTEKQYFSIAGLNPMRQWLCLCVRAVSLELRMVSGTK